MDGQPAIRTETARLVRYFRIADDTARISLLSSEHGACDLIHAIQKPMFKPQYQLVVQVKGVKSADFDWLVQWENDLA